MDQVDSTMDLSSRAIGEGSAVDRFDSGDRRAFPLGPWFRSLPRASYFSFLVKRGASWIGVGVDQVSKGSATSKKRVIGR
jgi:hypothetical protein